jgi:hypothetical protein
MRLTQFFLWIVALVVISTGCRTVDSDSTAQSSVNPTGSGLDFTLTGDLYKKPNFEPQHSCDHITTLKFVVKGDNGSAELVNGIDGECAEFVSPDKRIYQGTVKNDGCGSLVFTGTRKGASGTDQIRVTDHRGRLCEDIIPALVTVIETKAGLPSVHLFSSPEAPFKGSSDNGHPEEPGGLAENHFHLFDKPHAQTGGFCDRFVTMNLMTSPDKNVAKLENSLEGVCEIVVVPDPRTYNLTGKEDGCGSMIYKGTTTANGRNFSIEITDNRGRTCENVIAALIVATEQIEGFPAQALFSKDN